MSGRSSVLRILVVLFLLCSPAVLAKKKPPEKPVNINTASSAQLQEVPGIGPATAEKILQMRKSYGAFKSVDDLLAIRGLGPKRLEKMRKYLTTGKQAAKSSAPNAAAKSATPAAKAAAQKPVKPTVTSTSSDDQQEEPQRR
jgi:competence ComEA-like helix-hairpin-helix protein